MNMVKVRCCLAPWYSYSMYFSSISSIFFSPPDVTAEVKQLERAISLNQATVLLLKAGEKAFSALYISFRTETNRAEVS